jgi:hypothetical protein
MSERFNFQFLIGLLVEMHPWARQGFLNQLQRPTQYFSHKTVSKIACTLALLIFYTNSSFGQSLKPDGPAHYRKFTMNLRQNGEFKVPMPARGDLPFGYKIILGEPIYPEPILSDIGSDMQNPRLFSRKFWDRVWLKDGSYITIGEDQVPLTCVFISGQDNRYSGPLPPTIPEYIIKVFLVANDFTCKGPIKPGWPQSGGKKENWDTYLHYEVRDPTIMLPVDIKLRYRWNEFPAILVR